MRLLYLIILSITICFRLNAQWSDLNSGVNGRVSSMYVDSASGLLFVGGNFSTAGSSNINSIATWDGTNWNSFGTNDLFSSPRNVSAIVNYNGYIIIAGDFDSIGLIPVNNIAKWNGVTWESLGNGFDDYVTDIIVYKNE